MNSTALLGAIIGHLVGDYLLQNDWMANNKKKSSWPCAIHCVLWTVAVLFFSGWGAEYATGWKGVIIGQALLWSHFVQDRTQIIGWWMRLKWKDQTKFAEAPMAPWSLIVVDNVWHIVALWAVWKFLIPSLQTF
jgi:hypothetical protein